MIRLLPLLLLLIASPAWGAVAHVQSDWDAVSGSSTTHAYNSGLTTTNGNAIVIAVRWNSNTVTATVADGQGNTYNSCEGPTTDNGGSIRLQVFVAHNITGGASYTPTVTYSSAVTERALAFHEVSGVATSSPCDDAVSQAQSAPGGTSNAISSGNATTTTNGAYIFGATVGDSSTPIDDVQTNNGTGFTLRPNATSTCCGHNTIVTESQVQTSAGSIAATFTNATGTGEWVTAVVALKDAAAGGGGNGAGSLVNSQIIKGKVGGSLAR